MNYTKLLSLNEFDRKKLLEEFDKNLFNDDGWDMRMYQETKAFFLTTHIQSLREQNEELERIKESDKAHTPSKNEDASVEDLYDWICSQIGFEKGTKELRDGIRLFGKRRFNQAITDIQTKNNEKISILKEMI